MTFGGGQMTSGKSVWEMMFRGQTVHINISIFSMQRHRHTYLMLFFIFF